MLSIHCILFSRNVQALHVLPQYFLRFTESDNVIRHHTYACRSGYLLKYGTKKDNMEESRGA